MLFLGGCQHSQHKIGYSFTDMENITEKLKELEVGKADEIRVLNTLGSPSFISTQNGRTFYYIQISYNKRPILPPKVTKLKVLRISFTSQHIVDSILLEEEIEAGDFAIVDHAIKVKGGQGASIWNQFIDNLGRFENQKKM